MQKLEDLNQIGIEHAIQDFYKKLSAHTARIVMDVAHDRYSIPREPRRMGNAQFDFYLAADLDLLFRYALGGVEASGTLIEELIRKVIDLLELAPNGGRAPIDWKSFSETFLGIAMKASQARVKLRRQSEPLSAEEVYLLSGWSSQKLASAKIAKTSKRSSFYEPGAVKKALERKGIRT